MLKQQPVERRQRQADVGGIGVTRVGDRHAELTFAGAPVQQVGQGLELAAHRRDPFRVLLVAIPGDLSLAGRLPRSRWHVGGEMGELRVQCRRRACEIGRQRVSLANALQQGVGLGAHSGEGGQ
jgi:hypothetical protein